MVMAAEDRSRNGRTEALDRGIAGHIFG